MSKISIIHISDIHYEKNEPENQGLVINSFFDDLDSKIDPENIANTYCIISGDLVNKGNSEKAFIDFYKNFILKLKKYIPIQNIFCSPGNHDLNRQIVEGNIDEHNDLLIKQYNETEFNGFINHEGNLIHKKFKFYKQFCEDKMHMTNFNINGYSEKLIPEITLYFLNCSLLCSGGFNGIEDKGKLKIETSGLNKWIQENKGRTKILVMHHPIDYLTNFAQTELKSMLKGGIDILISGHIHDQDLLHTHVSDNQGLIKLGSPQLFSSKHDINGYALITFQNKKIETVEYREWVPRQRKFMAGQNFSGTENGVWSFSRSDITPDDFITRKLLSNFQKAMKSYSKTPTWVERTSTTCPPNSSKKSDSKRLDYIDIINNPIDYQVIAAPQFGLTCYAHYLSMKAWEIKKDCWIYLNANNWSYAKYHSDLDDALTDLNVVQNDVKCILLDNWKNSSKHSHKILSNIKKKFPNTPIILLSNYHDNIVLEGLDSEESHEGFNQIYLCELSRRGLRGLVQSFNSIHQIADENRVLERLDVDLVD